MIANNGKLPGVWPGISATYGWQVPYVGRSSARRSSRIEVVFSQHKNLHIEIDGGFVDVTIPAGGAFTLIEQETSFLRLDETCNWLEFYLEDRIVDAFSDWHPNVCHSPRPTFDGRRRVELEPHLQLLSIAHIFRRACLGASTLSEVEADTLAHLLVAASSNVPVNGTRRNPLSKAKLDRIYEFVEAGLGRQILLSDLAGIAAISPFHFTRLFKAATGLAPYQYVMARRLERARHMLLSTTLPVRDIGWSLGIDNVSHFRRKFVEQFGIRPNQLRGGMRLPSSPANQPA